MSGLRTRTALKVRRSTGMFMWAPAVARILMDSTHTRTYIHRETEYVYNTLDSDILDCDYIVICSLAIIMMAFTEDIWVKIENMQH